MTAVDDVVNEPMVEGPKFEGIEEKEADETTLTIETKQSRKREREVSLEPGTPQAATTDIDSPHNELKDRRKPAKKNRVSAQLDAAAEEEEPEAEENGESATAAASPVVSGSPPHETKIRQISQGVEDLTWKNMPRHPTPQPEHVENGTKHEPMDTEHDEPASQEPQTEAATAEQPLVVPGENPPLVQDDAGADEHAGEADPAEVPPEAQEEDSQPTVTADHEQPKETPSTPPQREASPMVVSPLLNRKIRRGSDSSAEQEKGLKRKMGDRTVSESKVPEEFMVSSEKKPSTATKRLRDDPDADENPRQSKRPTPPPDEEKKEESSTEASSQAATATESTVTESSAPSAASSGFAAYASTSSPFASVKGPSLFSTRSSPWASTSTSTFPSGSSSPKSSLGGSSLLGSSAFFNSVNSKPDLTPTPAPTPAKGETSLKRSGFEAFASSSSPFATAAKRSKSPPPTPTAFGHRSKSPVLAHHASRAANVNAFSAYAGGASPFAKASAAATKRASPALGEGSEAGAGASASATASAEASTAAGSEEENTKETPDGESEKDKEKDKDKEEDTFGARLRAQKDDEEEEDAEKKIELTEQECEEDEDTVYQVRGKLYSLGDGNAWKERGTGQLRLNVAREASSGARLLMRKEAVYTVILNVPLFKGMKCFLAPSDQRYLRFSGLEKGAVTHYNLRVSNAKIATELLEEITVHIPGE